MFYVIYYYQLEMNELVDKKRKSVFLLKSRCILEHQTNESMDLSYWEKFEMAEIV